jgi:hypothetical protein
MKWRRSDQTAVILLVIAAINLLVIQVVPFSINKDYSDPTREERFMGYEIWVEIFEELTDFGSFDALGVMISVALISGSLLVLCSPFLVNVVSGNRVIWWFVVSMSGLVLVSLTGYFSWMLLMDPPDADDWRPGPGLFMMMIFPVMHFSGILCILRRRLIGDLAQAPEGR